MVVKVSFLLFFVRNGQQLGSAVNSLFDHSKFEAMKSLSGWEAVRCDEHQYRAKIKVSRGAIFELSFDKWSEGCHSLILFPNQ